SSYALAPAVAVSSFIISTDVPLLFFWALALYAFIRLLEGRSALFGLMLAFAIALGLNAKYAMVYFPVLALAYLVLTPAARPALRRADMLFGLLAGFLGLIPNILWNAENGFITFAHTGDNIEGGGLSFALADFFGFVASQFAIAGPIILAVALYGLWRGFAKKSEGQAFPADRMVLFLSLPILTVLTLQAGLSRANPNWAATAFPALTLYASALMLRFGWRRMIAWNAALLGGIALVVLVFSAGARSDQMIVRRTNMKHMFGWEIVAAGIERAASEAGVTTVVIDNRKIAAAMVYYLRETGLDVRAYRRDGAPPTNHFELTRPADPATLQGPFLLVAQRAIESFGLAPERLDERDPITEEETRNWRQAARLYAVTPREEPDRER
ncbi:MAG: glycosyltransferase family 39 protein, partial [Hyphomicrobiaceae bacterium]|nr:glycosyltransferase family 39 protein [Hyphomicrobiaceae bacterium]